MKKHFSSGKNLFRDKIFYAFAFLCWVDKQSGPDIVEPSQPKLFRACCIVDQCVVLRTILLYSVRHLMLYGRAHTHIYRQSIHQQMCLHSLEIFVATNVIPLHLIQIPTYFSLSKVMVGYSSWSRESPFNKN